ncbi:hypothetical protein NDU88_011533 [Pleurodeles waltl]|uniref:Uncharacterized protein n=1 Tax=Pleurodeles waltl TaxID=8319 RepID=A0AAV7PY14_PLEWA|nr:hypothetical protein NDU88_011533 [Pleurodeles waltl]
MDEIIGFGTHTVHQETNKALFDLKGSCEHIEYFIQQHHLEPRLLVGRGRATKKDDRLIRELRVAANTGALGALRWQENILCTATPAPTTVVPRSDAWRHREGDRGAKISRPAQAPSFPMERAWLEGQSRLKGEPHTVRPWNRLTSRGTVRSSLHKILRSPEEIRRGVEDPHSTRPSCRRAGTTEKAQTNGDGALQHKRLASTTANPQTSSPPTESTTMAEKSHSTTMDRILQEITTVSRRIEGMDASITSPTLETKSMRAEIAGFQSRVTGLEQRMGLVEAQTTMSRDRDQDLLYLRSKLTDMEDRSRRDNIRLHGIPENEEGVDVQSFLRSILPKLTSLDFDPPIEFQRAHRVGPKHPGNSSRPRPIIACLLWHNQTRQILQAARKHGPFQLDQYDIRITADYSKETNDRRKAFLALRPRLRQLEIKYGLFDPARIRLHSTFRKHTYTVTWYKFLQWEKTVTRPGCMTEHTYLRKD